MSRGSILVRLPNWIGDGALAAPALRALAAARPDLRLILVGTPRSAPLYARWPCDGLFVVGRRSNRDALRLVRTLRGTAVDEALLLSPSFRSALPPLFLGARRRVGFSSDRRGLLLTDAVATPDRETHLARQYLTLASRLGADPDAPLDPLLPVGADEEEAAGEMLAERGLAGERTVALCHGATYGATKRWPLDHWIELGKGLTARGYSVVLLGGEGERPVGEEVRAGIGEGAFNLAGGSTVRGTLALLRRLAGAVGNDSGPMHLAAAAGCPVVGIFGSTNPAWTGPLGERSRFVSLRLPCSPCYASRCPTRIECLIDLDPGRILEVTEEVLSGGRGGAA